MRLLFHGTSHLIKDLASIHIGKGGDPSSALGFHTTDSPFTAAEYADISVGRDPGPTSQRILAILVSDVKSYVEGSFHEFFGADEVGEYFKTHDDFADWRDSLLQKGFNLVELDNHEDEIAVILDPSSDAVRIVAELNYDEAMTLQDRYEQEDLTYEETHRRVALLKEVILERQVEPTMEGMSP